MKEFLFFAISSMVMFGVVAVGVVYYLKRRGVLRAAANAATQAVKQDVQQAADKLTK